MVELSHHSLLYHGFYLTETVGQYALDESGFSAFPLAN
jgi:hypothetical protein